MVATRASSIQTSLVPEEGVLRLIQLTEVPVNVSAAEAPVEVE